MLNTTYVKSAIDINSTLEDSFLLTDVSNKTGHVYSYDGDVDFKATDGLFDDFGVLLQQFAIRNEILPLIDQYAQMCAQRVSVLKKMSSSLTAKAGKERIFEMLELIEGEQQTWQLLVLLYSDRLNNFAGAEMDSTAMEYDNVYKLIQKSPLEPNTHDDDDGALSYKLSEQDPFYRELLIIRKWCESIAASHIDDNDVDLRFSQKTYLRQHSLHRLNTEHQQGVIVGQASQYSRRIVKSLDPDAPCREHYPLHDRDGADEEQLLNTLLDYVKSGQIQKAVDLCVHCGQAWRGATIVGGQLRLDTNHDGGMYSSESDLVLPQGNGNRRSIWRAVCWHIALDTNLSRVERAIYGALSGHGPSILPLCNTWHECVWAFVKCCSDYQLESFIDDVTKRDVDDDDGLNNFIPLPNDPKAEHLDFKMGEIFDEIGGARNEFVRNQAKTVHAIAQRSICCSSCVVAIDTIAPLLSQLVIQFNRNSTEDVFDSSSDSVLHSPKQQLSDPHRHIVRFMAHFAILIPLLDHSVDVAVSTHAIECYIQTLIADSKRNLVAIYCKCLPDPELQVLWYSKLCEDIHVKGERDECLELAIQNGLDVPEICWAVVERVKQRHLKLVVDGVEVAADTVGSPLSLELESEITFDDSVIISALEWLLMADSMYARAILQCNSILRQFLLSRKFEACKRLFDLMPNDFVTFIQTEQQSGLTDAQIEMIALERTAAVREFMALRSYVHAVDCFNQWFHYFHSKKPKFNETIKNNRHSSVSHGPSYFMADVGEKVAKQQFDHRLSEWNHMCTAYANAADTSLFNILMCPDGWLIDSVEHKSISTFQRDSQCRMLRKQCIPLCVEMLRTVNECQGNIRNALQIADVLAHPKYALYKEFDPGDLKLLLQKLTDVSITGLNNHKDAFGYDV